jgi:FkbM family methyltransferase
MKYYGQWETDRVIESYFPGQVNGRCVEVGAYDGVKGSNTKYFEDLGWETTCIEPNPFVFLDLLKNRNGRCLNIAVGCHMGISQFEIFDFKSGIQSSLSSLKTDPRLIEEYGDAITKRTYVEVPVMLLGTLMDLNNIDFVSIDTEGTEYDVLLGMHLYRQTPKLLVVENNYEDEIITKYIKAYGYKFDQRYKVNDFYLRGDLC